MKICMSRKILLFVPNLTNIISTICFYNIIICLMVLDADKKGPFAIAFLPPGNGFYPLIPSGTFCIYLRNRPTIDEILKGRNGKSHDWLRPF